MMRERLDLPFLLLVAIASAHLAVARDLQDLDLTVHASDIEPSVSIKTYENRTVEEYRVNNHLYKIKITPAVGAPYYLVDEDGSGDMAWHRGQPDYQQNVPQWTLASW
jgi:hypothetical protein